MAVLSLRYLRSRRIALVALVSIALGVMAMIVVVALMDGVESFLRGHLRATRSDCMVRYRRPEEAGAAHATAVSRELGPELVEAGGPIAALAPRREAYALAIAGEGVEPGAAEEEAVEGVRLLGIDWEAERRVAPLDRMLSEVGDAALRVAEAGGADPLTAGNAPAVLLGDSLARRLRVARVAGAGRPAVVTLVSGRATAGPDGTVSFDQSRHRAYAVAGCFTTGREDYDAAHVLIDRRELIRLLDETGRGLDANEVHVRFRDGVEPLAALNGLSARHPRLNFRSWETEARQELLALQDQKDIMVVILFCIVLVASVAILGIVWLMVVEKTREIGILRAMGLSRLRLVMVFTLYGVLLGILGCGAGILLGLQVTARLDSIVGWLSEIVGVDLLDPRIYRFKTVPTRLNPAAVALIAAVALCMSFVASLIPALRAASLTPVRALRSE